MCAKIAQNLDKCTTKFWKVVIINKDCTIKGVTSNSHTLSTENVSL